MIKTCSKIFLFILSCSLILNLAPCLASNSRPEQQPTKTRPHKNQTTPPVDSGDDEEEDEAPHLQSKEEYRHWRLTGGLFYLWRSVKALQAPDPARSSNAFPSSSTAGNSMHLFGALGSVTYFTNPHFGFGLNGGVGKGELLALEFELVPTTLGKSSFDFSLLGGFGIFSANGADGTLLRLQLGCRTSFNLSPTMGISGAFRFAPFASTVGNTIDLLSLGDLLQVDFGVFWRL